MASPSPATTTALRKQRRNAVGPGKRALAPSRFPEVELAPHGEAKSRAEVIARTALLGLLLAAGVWSYWPTLINLVTTWTRVPDYSHGFVVVPFAVLILWLRRDRFPGLASTSPWIAAALLVLSLLLRHAGDVFFFAFLGGWSIIPWCAAVAALVGGRPLLAWSWPAIVFLLFMVPLPFSIEYELSGPLQRMATVMSTAVLQFLGQPAFAEGNTILLGDERLEVAQACSGLRLFMGIIALTYVYVALIRRPWWEKAILVVATVPIAIGANVARIVTTGLLYQVMHDAQSREWIHSAAGWVMVLVAAAAFWLLLGYLRRLFKEEYVMDMSAVVKQARV
jgi:exosortase